MLDKMSQYFPQLYDYSVGNIKIELDLTNYEIKARVKGATGVDTSNLATKSDLFSLKAGVNKINIDKLKIVPLDFSKIRNVVDNDFLKRLSMINLLQK